MYSSTDLNARRSARKGVEMRKKYVCLMIFLFIILTGFFLVLCSCFMKESYKDFYVSKIDDFTMEEYFTSNELSFARMDDVVIAPYIHATNHDEYTVDIILYSKLEQKQVTVKSVSIKEDEHIFFSQEIKQSDTLKRNENGIFQEWIRSGTFTGEEVNLSDGKKLYLTVQIQVEKGTQKTIEEICYEIVIIQYMSFLTPT